MSSLSSSSSDETPRPQEKFQDFDFFDSDTENKAVVKPPAKKESNTASANRLRKAPHEDELHGQGIGRSSVDNRRSDTSSESDERNKKSKTNTSSSKRELKHSSAQSKRTPSPLESKERVTIHVPHEGSFRDSDSDSSSVTDVSPLQSPDATPRPRSALRRKKPASASRRSDSIQQTKTKFVIKESSPRHDEERPHARRSNGEALSVEDLLYSSDGTPLSSGDRDAEAGRRRKVQRKKKNRHDEIHHRIEASSRHHRRRLLDVAAQNSMDISQLLEVVLEMEQENKARRMFSSSRGPSHVGPSPIKPIGGKNKSFSNEQVRDIDKENERLLKRLTQLCANSRQARPSSASSVRSGASSIRSTASSTRSSRRPATSLGMRSSPNQGPRQYHSATNRIRDQQRIERENLAFLKRLQAAKASSSLRRDNLLHDYQRQTGRPVEPMRPRRRQKTGYTRQDDDYDGRPVWQDSW